jgi:hypothetical protein
VALQAFDDPASTDIDKYNPWPTRYASEDGCQQLCANRVDCAGYSWRAKDATHVHYHKCFLVARAGGAGKASAAFESALCGRTLSNTTWAARGHNGTYTGLSFAAEAVRVVEATPADGRPLFLYLALRASTDHRTRVLDSPQPAPFAEGLTLERIDPRSR